MSEARYHFTHQSRWNLYIYYIWNWKQSDVGLFFSCHKTRSETYCHPCFSHFLPPGCTAAPLSASVSLSWSFSLYLALPLSPLMTVSRADRQIYLHWWQGRKKSSAKPCPASGLWQAGLRGNPDRLAPPRAGHISLCCPWPCSELSARWDQSFTGPQTHTLPHQPLGEKDQKRGGRKRKQHREQRAAASVHTGWEKHKKKASVFVFFPFFSYTSFLLELLMRQAGSAPSHLILAPRGGRGARSVYRFSSVCDFILQLLNTGTVL